MIIIANMLFFNSFFSSSLVAFTTSCQLHPWRFSVFHHLCHSILCLLCDGRPRGVCVCVTVALHGGGPGFKASPRPPTNCGLAAREPVGEKLFTGLFSMSSLSSSGNTARKTAFLFSEPLWEVVFQDRGENNQRLFERKKTRPVPLCFSLALSLLLFLFFKFFPEKVSMTTERHRVWLTFQVLFLLHYTLLTDQNKSNLSELIIFHVSFLKTTFWL